MARAVVLICTVVVLPACGRSPTQPTRPDPPRPPQLSRTKFVAFGDSIVVGTTSPAVTTLSAGLPQSFTYKLQELLTTRYAGQTFTVENEGLPAETAFSGVFRLPSVLREKTPEVVIILHGVTDVTFGGLGSVPRVVGYIATMASDARAFGADVIVCTLPPQRPGGFRAGDPVVIGAYNQALRDGARAEGIALVDFDRLLDLSLMGVDGLHPTEPGYARMAELLLDAIRARYETRLDGF